MVRLRRPLRSAAGARNLHRECRDTTLNGAANQMYQDTPRRPYVQPGNIPISSTTRLTAKDCKRAIPFCQVAAGRLPAKPGCIQFMYRARLAAHDLLPNGAASQLNQEVAGRHHGMPGSIHIFCTGNLAAKNCKHDHVTARLGTKDCKRKRVTEMQPTRLNVTQHGLRHKISALNGNRGVGISEHIVFPTPCSTAVFVRDPNNEGRLKVPSTCCPTAFFAGDPNSKGRLKVPSTSCSTAFFGGGSSSEGRVVAPGPCGQRGVTMRPGGRRGARAVWPARCNVTPPRMARQGRLPPPLPSCARLLFSDRPP